MKVKIDRKKAVPDSPAIMSFTECTGLMPTPPHSEEEEQSYKELYSTALPRERNRIYDHREKK